MYKSIIALYIRESTNFYLRRVGGLKGRREIYSWKKREKELLSIVKYKIYFFVDNEYPYCFYKCEILYVKKGGGTMKKRLVGAVTLITAVAGVIYMKNNPKYKEIIQMTHLIYKENIFSEYGEVANQVIYELEQEKKMANIRMLSYHENWV